VNRRAFLAFAALAPLAPKTMTAAAAAPAVSPGMLAYIESLRARAFVEAGVSYAASAQAFEAFQRALAAQIMLVARSSAIYRSVATSALP
jgi:hypothetical protein